MSRARILVVEDHAGVAEGLRAALEADQHVVDVVGDGETALSKIRSEALDLIVLDVMLPGINGFAVLERIRQEGRELPVLLLTALGQEMDKVRGFRAGADGYAVKPVGVLELQARVSALLRRRGPAAAALTYAFGDVRVDAHRRTVVKNDEAVELSPREFDLLLYLLRLEGGVARRAALLKDVWGYRNPVSTRTVDAHMKALRAKLEDDPGAPRHLLTVRKVGYRLDAG